MGLDKRSDWILQTVSQVCSLGKVLTLGHLSDYRDNKLIGDATSRIRELGATEVKSIDILDANNVDIKWDLNKPIDKNIFKFYSIMT